MDRYLKVYRMRGSQAEQIGDIDTATRLFSYAGTYLATSGSMPISHSLPLRDEPYDELAFKPYFEGLVPEGTARAYMAAELGVREDDYLAMLGFCGIDCVGDLMICADLPVDRPAYSPISTTELSQLFGRGAGMAELSGSSRLSLAGTQSKVGLARHPGGDLREGWLRPHGTAASTHILKRSSTDAVSFFEYLCMNAADHLGLRVAKTSLVDLGAPIICSERFDRSVSCQDGCLAVRRLHQEDFSQVFGVASYSKYAELASGSYASIARFILEFGSDPVSDLRELVRLTLFNYLIGNCDNHLKNLSVVYDGEWRDVSLAPAYDLVCTTWFPNLTRRMGMKIGDASDIDEVNSRDLMEFAHSIGVSVRLLRSIARELVDTVESAIRASAAIASDEFDELDWKADELLQDMEPRRLILERV